MIITHICQMCLFKFAEWNISNRFQQPAIAGPANPLQIKLVRNELELNKGWIDQRGIKPGFRLRGILLVSGNAL